MSQYFSFLRIKCNLPQVPQPSPGRWKMYWELSNCCGGRPLSPSLLGNSRILELVRPENRGRRQLVTPWWSPALPLLLHAVSAEHWSSPSISWMPLCRWAHRHPSRSRPHGTRTWHPAAIPQAGLLLRALVSGTPSPHFSPFLDDHSPPKSSSLHHNFHQWVFRNLLLALFQGAGRWGWGN